MHLNWVTVWFLIMPIINMSLNRLCLLTNNKLVFPSIYSIFSGSSRQFSGFDTNVDEYILDHIWERARVFFPSLKELPLNDFTRSREVRVGLRPYSESQYPLDLVKQSFAWLVGLWEILIALILKIWFIS